MLLLRIIISVTFRRVTFRCSARRQAWAICCATSVTCTPSSKLGTRISTLGCRSPRSGFLKQKKHRAPTEEHIGYFGHSIYEAQIYTHQSHPYKHHETSTNHEFLNLQPPKNMPRRGWCRLPNEEVPGE